MLADTLTEGIPNKTVKVMCVFYYFLYILETQNKISAKLLVQLRTWEINQQPIFPHILIYTQNGNSEYQQNVIISSLSHYQHFLKIWLNLIKIRQSHFHKTGIYCPSIHPSIPPPVYPSVIPPSLGESRKQPHKSKIYRIRQQLFWVT